MLACAGKKRRENPKEKAHLQQRNQVFPISIMETLLSWVLLSCCWPVCDESRLVWECEAQFEHVHYEFRLLWECCT